jgi:UDP-GlcNAc:undecaprenyl-phosphate GlcNAc-1-phosphate transferase
LPDLPHTVVYATAFLMPLLSTLWLTPVAARLARRFDLLDRPRPNKFHRQATPYLGGVAIAAGLISAGMLTTSASGQFLTILLGGVALGVIGLLDDWRTVRPSTKLLVEGAAGVLLWIAGVRAGIFGSVLLDLPLTLLWVIGVVNAVNMLDNMDGVTPGVVAIAGLAFFAIAADRGDYLVASLALTLGGASIGFLRYNFPPARIFLGDAGTLMIGFLLAGLGLKLDLAGEAPIIRAAIPTLIVGVAFLDMVFVIVSRLRDGRPTYVGGVDHASHRLASLGLSGSRVALTMYAVEFAYAATALWILHASVTLAVGTLVGVAGLSVASVGVLLRISSKIELKRRLPDENDATPGRIGLRHQFERI